MARRKLAAVTQWTSFDEPNPAETPAWVRNVRFLLVFVYPAVAIGAAAFLVWATLGFNSYLINVPAWRMVFLTLLVAAVAKSMAFALTGKWLQSHHDRTARSLVLAVSWLGGPGVSLLMLVLSAAQSAGLGEDVVIVAIPEACVAATITLSMRPSRRA